MRLDELLKNIPELHWPLEKGSTEITALSCDSREAQQGALFVALSGAKFRGVDFVADVVAKGAAAVVIARSEAPLLKKEIPAGVVIILAADPKALLRTAARCFYGDPSRSIQTIGITGTNGKTTFTYLMESILHHSGEMCGVIGTVNYRIGKEILPAPNTTPGFLDLQRFYHQMLGQGARHCVMEVSSHALDQGRVDNIHFNAAVFSNLTQDHLDYHQDMESYFLAKALLFKGLSSNAAALINGDDPYGRRLCKMTQAKVITFGIDSDVNVKAVGIHYTLTGTTFDVAYPSGKVKVITRLIGKHNVYNILAAFACAYALGFKMESVVRGIESMANVPGRLEAVETRKGFHVFIDYAHTEDGLVNVLKALREVSSARITTVFGCGGDRDRAKRPKMGAAVCALSDHAIITSDNPRSEDPLAIIEQIVAGFNKKNYDVCPDRKEAIRTALKEARPGDIILLAGKGHEDYQILKEGKIQFNEAQIVKEYLGV